MTRVNRSINFLILHEQEGRGKCHEESIPVRVQDPVAKTRFGRFICIINSK